MEGPIGIILECTRTSIPEDPFAFRFEPQDYTLRSPGGAVTRFRIVWSEALLHALEELRRPGPDPALVQRLGELLRRALSASSWREAERAIVDAGRAGRRVHVTLRSNAAELFALPWELLTVGAGGQHLGELAHVVLRHEWPESEPGPAEPGPAEPGLAKPSPRPAGGRILLAWSAAGGEVPASEHLEAIASACRSGFADFDRAQDVLAHASARSLAGALERAAKDGEPYAVLHLLCHGGAAGSSFGLTLDAEGGGPQVVDAGRLRQLIATHAATPQLVVLSACDSGNAGALGNQLGSVAQALHRAGVRSVVASRYPLSVAGSITLTAALYRGLLVDLRSLEQALSGARSELALTAGSLDWASVQLYARAKDGDDTRPVVLRPYRGLEVFESQHRRLFFGRDREADEAVVKIEALARSTGPRMFFLSGISGSGKSSLARAAVVPRLLPKFAEVLIARPGDLCDSLPAARPLLLMLDQAEELFTVLDADARAGVIERLDEMARDEKGSVVLFTLRADFIGRCGEITLPDGRRLDALESDNAHRVYVPVLDRSAMVKVISGPAALAGLRLQDGLAEQLVDEVAGEPGALPLLEFTLDRMWSARDPRNGLTLAGYKALGGGVGGVLEREADGLIKSLEEPERAEARRLLVQLVATGEGQRADTRRVRRIADLRPSEPEVFDEVLARLTAARLVVTSGDSAPQVEIAHEELIRRWGRLRAWVDADRQKWIEIERVRGWDQLLRGAQLDRAREAWRLYGTELGERALAHLRESERVLAAEEAREQQTKEELQQAKAKAEEEAERARQRAVVAGGMALVAVVVTIVAVIFYVRANEASRETRREAERAKLAAKKALSALRLAGARLAQIDNDPTAMTIILGEEEDPGASEGWLQASVEVESQLIARSLLRGHEGEVISVSFSPDGRSVVTASRDKTARVWRADGSGDPVVLRGHEGWVESASFSPDSRSVVTASWDKTARIWRADGSEEPVVLRGHERKVVSVSFSRDGRSIVTASWDGTARVWRADGYGEPVVLRGHKALVSSASFSPDGSNVVTASRDETARVWRADGLGEPVVLRGHEKRVLSASFSPDGHSVVTASTDGTARVWRADGSGEPVVLRGHEKGVLSASFSPDGHSVVTASQDETARVWRADGSGEPVVLRGHEMWVESASFSPDGHSVATASQDNTARVWRADGSGEPVVLRGHDGDVRLASFSPDGSSVVTASRDMTARVWRADGFGAPVALQDHDELIVDSVSFSPDGRSVVTGCGDSAARVWRADGYGEPVVLRGHEKRVQSASFSADGRSVITASADGTARVWRADGYGEPVVLRGHAKRVQTASFSPDGRSVVTASADRTARVWRADGSGEPVVLRGHEGEVASSSFSPDGRSVITASVDRTARVWRADGSGEPVVLRGHEGEVTSASFSPDGRSVITNSWTGTARVWQADGSGEPVVLRGYGDLASFSPDGRSVITADRRKTARVWTIDPLALSDKLRTMTTVCLTPKQRRRYLHEPLVEANATWYACERAHGRTPKLPKALKTDDDTTDAVTD